MNYTVRWLLSAAKDLTEIKKYLDKEIPEMASDIVGTIYEEGEGLNFMPTRFPFDDENPKYRRVVVYKTYKIFFRIVGETVQINYVRHTARNSKGLPINKG